MRTGVRDGRFVVHAAFVPSLVVCSEHDVDDVALLPLVFGIIYLFATQRNFPCCGHVNVEE